MITLTNLSKCFWRNGNQTIVADDISFTFPAGRSIALLGKNGAGKSTLLQLIAGTQRPTAGCVHRQGSVSWPVGFAGSFHPDLTGAQNARFVARIYGVDPGSLVGFVADFSDLGAHLFLPMRNYSTGMRARLAFGLSMGIQFDTYLVDEVTAVGDTAFKAKSAELFRDRLTHAGAIVVTHSMKQVRDLCDAGVVLHQGRLDYFENVNDAIERHREVLLS